MVSKVNRNLKMWSLVVFRVADWIEMWCSPMIRVISERMPVLSMPSTCSATRNELDAVGAQATSTRRSGWERRLCAFVQSTRWTETPLSLVTKIYVLRANEKFKGMTYPQITSAEAEKEALGEELIAAREIVLLPGKSYDITLKVPGDAASIGVVGMFRAPYQSRWKLAFDNKRSPDNGIIIGAHACAFNASKGALVSDISPETVRSMVGIQCSS